MDITSSIAALATNMSQAKNDQDVSVAVLKKALDMQASNAMALINALPPTPQNLPPNLGQNVNVSA